MMLELDLPPKTIKKLQAFALLSGKPIKDVESELAGMLDQFLTDACFQKLNEVDGHPSRPPQAFSMNVHRGGANPPTNQGVVKNAAPQVGLDVTFEDDSQNFIDETSGHSVADDEAEESTLSLQEQYEKEQATEATKPQEEESPFKFNFPSATDDESFLEQGPVQTPKQQAQPSPSYRRPAVTTGATKSFHKPRVRIAEHTGDEGGEYFGGMP